MVHELRMCTWMFYISLNDRFDYLLKDRSSKLYCSELTTYFRTSGVKVSIYYYMIAFIHHSVVLTYLINPTHALLLAQ